jgi:hypothetical protein
LKPLEKPGASPGPKVAGAQRPERRVLVVDEDAAVLDRGRALRVSAGLHVERLLVGGWDVVPPVPGGDADALGDVVGAEDRAALVAAGDHEGAPHAGHRVLHDLLERGLPLPGDGADVELARADELVDQRALADGSDEDDVALRGDVVGRDGGLHAGYALDVGLEVADDPDHARVVARADDDRRRLPAGHEREGPRRGGERDVAPAVGGCGGTGGGRGDGGRGEDEQDGDGTRAHGLLLRTAGRAGLLETFERFSKCFGRPLIPTRTAAEACGAGHVRSQTVVRARASGPHRPDAVPTDGAPSVCDSLVDLGGDPS